MFNFSKSLHFNYDSFLPVVAVAKTGGNPGELNGPEGVAIDETTGNIFITEFFNSRVSVFSQTGEFINSFKSQSFRNPWGIAIQNNNLYVSDINVHIVYYFKLPEMKLLHWVGKLGSGEEEFSFPQQICISHIGDVYVCDSSNNRIQVLTFQLLFKTSITHDSMTSPIDLKFMNELMYVLSPVDNPCLHVFTLAGDKIRSIISQGEELQIDRALFFCLDPDGNFIISDHRNDSVKVFTPEGEFCHQIGGHGFLKGMFIEPKGLAITKEGKLVCVSKNKKLGLQIFQLSLQET